MISAKAALTRLGINAESATRAVQEVRAMIEEDSKPLVKASKMVHDIIGLEKSFTDVKTAVHIVQNIAVTFIKHESYDEVQAWVDAEIKAKALRAAQPEAFSVAVTPAKRGETTAAVIEGINVHVAVMTDATGKVRIKKGGKGILAEELYKRHVLETEAPVTSKQFVAILEKELGMSKSGANTYSYNSRIKLGGEFATK